MVGIELEQTVDQNAAVRGVSTPLDFIHLRNERTPATHIISVINLIYCFLLVVVMNGVLLLCRYRLITRSFACLLAQLTASLSRDSAWTIALCITCLRVNLLEPTFRKSDLNMFRTVKSQLPVVQ